MKIERVKNSGRNVAFGLVNKAVMLIFPFVIRTILLRLLSSEYVGLSGLFTSVLSVLNLAELGFGSALVFNMYKPLASDDMVTIRAILNFYKKIYRIVGIIVLGVGLCVLPFTPHLISGDTPAEMNVYILFAIYLADTVLTYFLFPYSGCVLASLQRTDIESNIATAVNTVMYACQIASLFLFKNYYIFILFQPLFNSVTGVVKMLVVRKLYPEFYCEGKIDQSLVEDIGGRVKALFGHKLGTVVLYSVDSIVISCFLGLKELAIYNNYYYIHAAVLGILQVGYNAVKAGLGNSIVTEGKEKNYGDFKKLFFVNSCIVGWCTVCLLVLYNRFMWFWVGDLSLIYDNETVVLLCVYFYLNSMRWIVLTYKDAAGVWKEDAIKPYIESLCNIALNLLFVLVFQWGVKGVVLSSIIAVAFISSPWEAIALFKAYFKENPFRYFLSFLLYSLVSVAIAVGTYFLCHKIAPSYEVGAFFLRIAVLVVVPTAAYLLVYCKKSEMRACFALLKGYVHKK